MTDNDDFAVDKKIKFCFIPGFYPFNEIHQHFTE